MAPWGRQQPIGPILLLAHLLSGFIGACRPKPATQNSFLEDIRDANSISMPKGHGIRLRKYRNFFVNIILFNYLDYTFHPFLAMTFK